MTDTVLTWGHDLKFTDGKVLVLQDRRDVAACDWLGAVELLCGSQGDATHSDARRGLPQGRQVVVHAHVDSQAPQPITFC